MSFQSILDYISLVIGGLAVLIIVYGIIVGLLEFSRAEWRNLKVSRVRSYDFQNIRHDVGFHLLLGLEFLIAADIIRTVIRTSLEELAILGGIVAIRTVLSYFLGREISQYKKDETGPPEN
jgi:uncharacterized membrane protein